MCVCMCVCVTCVLGVCCRRVRVRLCVRDRAHLLAAHVELEQPWPVGEDRRPEDRGRGPRKASGRAGGEACPRLNLPFLQISKLRPTRTCAPLSSRTPAVCRRRSGVLGRWEGEPWQPLAGSAAGLPPTLGAEAGRSFLWDMVGQWDTATARLPRLASMALFAYSDAFSR